jgi:deoxyguanosine kinase
MRKIIFNCNLCLLLFICAIFNYYIYGNFLKSFVTIFIFYFPIKYYFYKYFRDSIIISIEGNIGSGKTTLINIIKEKFKDVVIIDEPLNEWLNLKNEKNNNLLDCFYSDKSRWSYTFQNFAYITRINKVLAAIKKYNNSKIIITERSIYTDKNIFAKMLFDSKIMSNMEYKIYNYWFKMFESNFEFNINYIIYLRVNPEISFNRIKIRKRKEEEEIKYDYIKSLHDYHDEWISSTNRKVCLINGDKDFYNNLKNQSKILLQIRKFIDQYK